MEETVGALGWNGSVDAVMIGSRVHNRPRKVLDWVRGGEEF
jgi:hypothetical protein